jgi:hypothetical protein
VGLGGERISKATPQPVEGSIGKVTAEIATHRKVFLRAMCLAFPATIKEVDRGLIKAEQLLLEGRGLVIILLHYSRRDPFEALKITLFNPVMRERRIIVPIAYHHALPGLDELAAWLGGGVYPVVTPRTIKKMGDRAPDPRPALEAYMSGALTTLKDGGIVVFAPQGERQPSLGKPNIALRYLERRARRKGITDFGLMFVSPWPGEEAPFDYEQGSGWNFRIKWLVLAGSTFTLQEAGEEAKKSFANNLDAWAFNYLAQIAPPGYVSPGAEF